MDRGSRRTAAESVPHPDRRRRASAARGGGTGLRTARRHLQPVRAGSLVLHRPRHTGDRPRPLVVRAAGRAAAVDDDDDVAVVVVLVSTGFGHLGHNGPPHNSCIWQQDPGHRAQIYRYSTGFRMSSFCVDDSAMVRLPIRCPLRWDTASGCRLGARCTEIVYTRRADAWWTSGRGPVVTAGESGGEVGEKPYGLGGDVERAPCRVLGVTRVPGDGPDRRSGPIPVAGDGAARRPSCREEGPRKGVSAAVPAALAPGVRSGSGHPERQRPPSP